MFIEDASQTLIPGLCGIEILTRTPEANEVKTYWVDLAVHAHAKPQALIADLARVGFAERTSSPMPYPCARSGIMVTDVRLTKPGTAMFHLWRKREETENLAAIMAVLARHSIINVRPRRMQPEELVA